MRATDHPSNDEESRSVDVEPRRLCDDDVKSVEAVPGVVATPLLLKGSPEAAI